MTRWLLNTFPTWLLGIIVVGAFAALGAIGHRVVQRRFSHVMSEANNELAGRLIGVLIGMYGIMLAFVIVSLYQEMNATEANVRAEATELAQLYRDSGAFSADVSSDIHDAIGAYVHTVVEEEWALMEDGMFSGEALAEIEDLYRIYQSYEPADGATTSFYEESIKRLNDLVGARRERLQHAEHSLPTPLVILLLGGALLVVTFLSFAGSSNSWTQTVMISAVAAVIGFNILLVISLDHPFSGDISVSSQPFEEGVLGELFEEAVP